MTVVISSACNIGSVRTNNEDMLLIKDQFIRDQTLDITIEADATPSLFAVSDGMGGHAAGELASEFTLQRMSASIASMPAEMDEVQLQAYLNEQILSIHHSLNELGKQNPEMQGLGCTFTGILLYQSGIYSIHVGDSRLYRQRRDVITQLTKDHTLRNMLNDPSIPANKIANSLGGGVSDLFFDFENLTDRVLENDILLLCSDGLSGEVTDDELEAAISSGADANLLVNLANHHGGNDNISALLITIQ